MPASFPSRLVPALFAIAVVGVPTVRAAETQTRPNVVIIAIDDLNDWVGSFGGNPQTRTPNMDKFCAEGAVSIQNAYCPGPVCGPSRSALLSGFMPNRTGIYSNSQNMRRSPIVQTHATLPEYFAQAGYTTLNRGKLFHKHATPAGLDEGQWAITDWSDTTGTSDVDRAHLYSRLEGIYGGKKGDVAGKNPDDTGGDGEGTEFSWGPSPDRKEDTLDWQTAEWAAGQLGKKHDKPFLMVVGISKPHLPWYVPQEYFDRHPLDSIKIPEHHLDDLDDILTPAGKKKFGPTADFRWVQQDDLFKRAVQGYLASASYADDCVGLVLDALAKSPEYKNTIVVIFGDHGWHLGEKLRFRKATLWQEATRLPLMIRVPGPRASRSPKRIPPVDQRQSSAPASVATNSPVAPTGGEVTTEGFIGSLRKSHVTFATNATTAAKASASRHLVRINHNAFGPSASCLSSAAPDASPVNAAKSFNGPRSYAVVSSCAWSATWER
jgi:arylsulfatase A-like enzyme